jgi:hypothetical protein
MSKGEGRKGDAVFLCYNQGASLFTLFLDVPTLSEVVPVGYLALQPFKH